MNLYLDTSTLVKLCFDESDRDLAIEAIATARKACTSVITYAEARAAFARKVRDGTLDRESHGRVVGAFDTAWKTISRLDVTTTLAVHAGGLAHRFGLRGYNDVHLATALRFNLRYDGISFLAFDRDLLRAASQAHLPIFGEKL